jgi:hypothetical protein
MSDNRKNNGGHKTAGRKSKAEELKLIEKLTPYEDTAINLLIEKMEAKDINALKMFFEYLYGKPKQQIESKTELSFPKIDMNDWK